MSQDIEASSSPIATSSPSTTPGSHNDFLAIAKSAAAVTKSDETSAALERLYQREADLRRQERFVWVFILTLIGSTWVFHNVQSAPGCFLIFLLTLIFLGFMASWLGVEQVAVPISRLFEAGMRLLPSEKPKSE